MGQQVTCQAASFLRNLNKLDTDKSLIGRQSSDNCTNLIKDRAKEHGNCVTAELLSNLFESFVVVLDVEELLNERPGQVVHLIQ